VGKGPETKKRKKSGSEKALEQQDSSDRVFTPVLCCNWVTGNNTKRKRIKNHTKNAKSALEWPTWEFTPIAREMGGRIRGKGVGKGENREGGGGNLGLPTELVKNRWGVLAFVTACSQPGKGEEEKKPGRARVGKGRVKKSGEAATGWLLV